MNFFPREGENESQNGNRMGGWEVYEGVEWGGAQVLPYLVWDDRGSTGY